MTAKHRAHWVLIAFLVFFGIFVGSITCRVSKGVHIPQRAASRAIGANTGLMTAAHVQESATFFCSIFVLALLLSRSLDHSASVQRQPILMLAGVRSSLWLPPLLFRPPPVSFAV